MDGVKINFDVVSSSTMYIAPPLVAVQLLKLTSFNVRVFEAGMVTMIAPPFPDLHSHDVKWIFERVAVSDEMVENANTPPFPPSRVIEENVFVPFSVRLSIETSIKGAFFVVYVDVPVMVIDVSVRVDAVTPMREHPSFISL